MSDEDVRLKQPEKKHREEERTDLWLNTYSDLMGLLLCFFVLIVSFSNTELIKFRQAMGALQGSTGALTDAPGSSVVLKTITRPDMQSNIKLRNNLDEFLDAVEAGYTDEIKNNDLSVEKVEDGIIIRLGDHLVFEPGQAQLKFEAYNILEKISKMILVNEYSVVVEGHTDNVPINSVQFPSNWDLSTARALSVLKYFTDTAGVDPNTIIAIGRGEFKPLAPNDTPENRAKNRRVEIFLNYVYLTGQDLLESRNFNKNDY
ncbi:MAG TPA: flagellar motor protein MotB [bacterium]|nr:flagellar motor protein MotB [bacterium]HPN43178.1 flagellar motor protein MotB [bacterium]